MPILKSENTEGVHTQNKSCYVCQRLEVVNYFIYLGMTLSMQLSFNGMAIDQATKAKRVLISL